MRHFPNHIYHIYNEGNNKQPIFLDGDDYAIFLALYEKLFPHTCSTIAYNLLPNHFHLLLYSNEKTGERIRQGGIYLDQVSDAIRKLLSNYTRIFNKKYKRTGSLFRQKTKSQCLSLAEYKIGSPSEKKIINCFNYIHVKPLLQKLTLNLEDWEYSSFNYYAGRSTNYLCNKDLAIAACDYNPENFILITYKNLHTGNFNTFI